MAELQEEQQNPDKVKIKFDTAVKQLAEVLGGENNLVSSNKVGKTELDLIVEGLLKEDREKNAKEVSEQLKNLLKSHAELKSSVKQKMKELEKLEQEKMKEFTKAAEQLFSRVESMKQKERDFKQGLSEATKG